MNPDISDRTELSEAQSADLTDEAYYLETIHTPDEYDADGNELFDADTVSKENCARENNEPVPELFSDWEIDVETEENENPASLPDFCTDSRPSVERRLRISESLREESLHRLELSARSVLDFQTLCGWYDREEQSRMRKERRYENLRGDVPLDYGMLSDGTIIPTSRSQPTFRQICRGEFDDYLANCFFEMHNLTDKEHLRKIIMELKPEHREILFFLGIRLYPTKLLAQLRGQTERNIRKVRDVVRRRIHKKLYDALKQLQQNGGELTLQEQDFLKAYHPAKNQAIPKEGNDYAFQSV